MFGCLMQIRALLYPWVVAKEIMPQIVIEKILLRVDLSFWSRGWGFVRFLERDWSMEVWLGGYGGGVGCQAKRGESTKKPLLKISL